MDDEKKQVTIKGTKALPGERRGRSPGGEAPPKEDKKSALCAMWLRVISREVPAAVGSAFPTRFHVWEPEPGKRLLLMEGDHEVVRVVPMTTLEAAALGHSHKTFLKTPLYLTPDTARTVAAHWAAIVKPIPEPRAFAWQDEPGLTFHRLPWARCAGDPGEATWPTWGGMLARMKNRDAFMAFIGSLFTIEAKHQQYCWVYGEGKDGKGTINSFLARALGSAYASKQTPNKGREHFWAFNLIGKRCVVFPDCSDPHFVRNGLFKAMVGRDPIEMEQKGQTSFTSSLSAMFLFFSNDRPRVSSQLADRRRLILCEFDPASVVIDPDFQDKLWSEGGYFLASCLKKYQAASPDHCVIPTDETLTDDCVDVHEFGFEAIFEGAFEIDVSRQKDWLTGANIRAILEHKKVSDLMHSSFMAWLKRTHSVRRVSSRRNGKNIKVYKGLCSIAGPADTLCT